MTNEKIYEITRGVWRVGQRRKKVVLALTVFHGVVQGVFQVESWDPGGTTPYATRTPRDVKVKGRWEFVGRTATSEVANRYLGKSVAHYFKQGNRNPVTYLNC